MDYGDYSASQYVMLELARRATGEVVGTDIETNRIGLLALTIGITTNKQSLTFPIPFSGLVRGESTSLSLDMGMASKTIQVDGIILSQQITKDNGSGNPISVNLTSYEVAQLIHSYVDASFLQEDQNISKLIILYPSKVDKNFVTRTGIEGKSLEELPLISFSWANRDYDVPSFTFLETPFPDSVEFSTDEIKGVTGFIDNFTTNFVGTESPQVTFNLTFTQASTVISDFINQAT
jgi:hypothetical protein